MTLFKLLFLLILLYFAVRAVRRLARAVMSDPGTQDRGSFQRPEDRHPKNRTNGSHPDRPARWSEDVEDAKFEDI